MSMFFASPLKQRAHGGRLRLAGFVGALVIAAAAALWGTASSFDEQLRLIRDTARHSAASGQVAIVEIDAQSLKQISNWPWPHRTHAVLIDQLRAAGATVIAFDVDFSATSNPTDDQALADALARAGGAVVLPTFRQPVSEGSTRFSENMPIAVLRDHAFLGSVNVQPDADGQLRRYSYGTVTAGIARPSIAALLANSPGNIGESFRVDTAIDPTTIPRVSAVDVLNGKTGIVKGRAVLIGATAIEMGDRYVVPGHGVLPGVVVQALAAETLIRRSTNPDWGPWPALLFAAAAIGITARSRTSRRWPIILAALGTLIAVPLTLEMANVASLQIAPALLLGALDVALVALLGLRQKLADSRLIDAVTGLPNARALARQCRPVNEVAVTVVRLQQFDEIAAVLNLEDRGLLMRQVVSRLLVAFPGSQMHAIEAGIIGWCSSDPIEPDEADAAAALFRAPIALANRSIIISPVFGISHGTGLEAERLLARANIAARQAQAAGKRWAFESSTLSTDTDRSIALIVDVEKAVADGDIYVVYQGKWDVPGARISGAEALVRWHHPVFGPLSPDAFIPVLESNGQMRTLTLAVVDICTKQLCDWHARTHDIGIAINISATLLDDRDFVADMAARLAQLGQVARHVTLEVTESATITSTDAAVAALTTFRSFGARVSIDDYGTGQATLAYLKSFPADEIKIDKSFVTNMLNNNGDQIVVRSTIELAHQLGFSVVAEGVEDRQCLDRLRDYGCDTIQGWVIGKPVKADAFIETVKLPPVSIAA
jgi:diguanylate cyclase